MKNRHLPLFKRNAAQAANRHGINMGELIGDHGLNDFLIDEVQPGDDPAEIAAKAIFYFCVDDGRFNGFVAGVEMTIQFLGETQRVPLERQQMAVALRDLKSILDTNATAKAIRQWIDAHFA